MRGRLFRYVVDDVDGIVVLVGDDGIAAFRGDGFGVELAQGRDFPDGAFEIALAEEVTGPRDDLAADDAFVGQVVAVDDDAAERGLLAFGDAELDVHRIVLDVHFHRIQLEEEETVVAVELRNVVIGLLAAAEQALVHRHHVVDVAFLDLEDRVELVGRIDGVARPLDVLVEDEVDGQAVGFHVIDRIAHDTRVAEAGLVELFEGVALVGFVFLVVELLAAE